jgi:hypothetical protein
MNWKLIGKKKKGILLHRPFSSMPAQLAHEASPHPPPSLPPLPSGPCALEWPTGQRPLSLHEPSCQGFSLKSTSPAHHMSPSGQNSRCCMPYPITSQLPPMPQYCMRMLQPSCHTAVQSPHTAALCARAILPPGVAMPLLCPGPRARRQATRLALSWRHVVTSCRYISAHTTATANKPLNDEALTQHAPLALLSLPRAID